MWKKDKPPHRELVEAMDSGGKIHRVKSIWGDPIIGVLPHWESEKGEILYHPHHFVKWRFIERQSEK